MRGAVLTSTRSISVDGRRFLRRLQASLKMAAGNIHSRIISIFLKPCASSGLFLSFSTVTGVMGVRDALFPCLKIK